MKKMYLIILVILFKTFLFDISFITSSSMERTLYRGDYIFINKGIYGLRLPKSLLDIPWLNVFSLIIYSNEKIEKEINEGWKYKYILRYGKIKHSDIIVFNTPYNSQRYFIKRCIALPGDTLQFVNNELYINGNLIEENERILFKYNLLIDSVKSINCFHFFDSLQIKYKNDWFNRKSNVKTAWLTNKQKKQLLLNKHIDSIIFHKDNLYSFSHPLNNKYQDIDNCIIVPKKGMVIELNNLNLQEYSKIITQYENVNIVSNSSSEYYINGVKSSFYTFKQNYYFVMGDNRSSSYNSRMFGFLPESTIVGKAVLVLFSYNHGFIWNRFFKKL